MSGTNPFRRRLEQTSSKPDTAAVETTYPARASPRIPPIDTDVQQPPRVKTSKTVRIISPHSASSDDENAYIQRFSPPSRSITSPPPLNLKSPGSLNAESSEDPFSAGSEGTADSTHDESTRQNTMNNSGTLQDLAPGRPEMPPNPFKRTLASSSLESDVNTTVSGGGKQDTGTAATNARPQYDVDDFKRLLLTGEKSTSTPNAPAMPPVSFQSQHSIGDNSSNTDASSISRQSIFEPVAEPLQESPGTSHEDSPSDDDRQQLVGAQSPPMPKSKPSAPRHRHGKLVKANAPQTVSFEDPSLSFANSDSAPKSPDTPGTIDKPLPPLPQTHSQSEVANHDHETIISEPTTANHDLPSKAIQQNPNPPTPPLSRRHSQYKPKPLLSSRGSASNTGEAKLGSNVLSQSPPTAASKAPPPPPPRRAGALVRVNSSSSASTSNSLPPTQSQSSTDDIISNPSKPQPPAPPNRSPTVFAAKRQQSQPSSGSSTSAPPPPPRRRGSSQSSYTPSRLSGDYRTATSERLRSDSGASSISHLQMTPMTATPSSTDSKDVMADLSALQREVDELRGKFRD